MSFFAIKTLFADRAKLLTALAGVIFSLVLVNIQGGLYFGLIGKASLLTDHSQADLWVGHRKVENVDFAQNIPEAWLNRIRGLSGVAEARPYIVGKAVATLPEGGFEDVWVIGADPATMLGGGWNFIAGNQAELTRPDGISIDELDAHKLGDPKLHSVIELNRCRATVVAKTRGVLGFMTTPVLFTNVDSARRFSAIPEGYCSYFLVKASPDTPIERLKSTIQERIPDADVYASEEFGRLSQQYFLNRTGIGVSFGASTLLGLFVGLLMVGQSLYALALDHLSEYATLKAMGAEDRQVFSVVILQALTIASIGTVLGIVMVFATQRIVTTPLAPIVIPIELICGGAVVVFGICLLSVLLPWLRIRRTDPATVLQT